jgi:hypothetical protein
VHAEACGVAREEFSLEGLATRLDGAKWFDDEEFIAYGLCEADIADLRQWAQAWCDEIRHRLYAENFDFDGGRRPVGITG